MKSKDKSKVYLEMFDPGSNITWWNRPTKPKNDPLYLQGVTGFMTMTRPIKGPCHYCGKLANTRDHIVPKAMHGTDAWWNLVPACADCNRKKADQVGNCTCEWCSRARFFMKQYLEWG